jgi:glycosyltransferase involved in cell wall biosynthesis
VLVQLISVVLPVYHQADHIEAIIADYASALARIGIPCEFIAVVNGSGDRSLEVCQDLARRNPAVRALYSERNGWGQAVQCGLEAARGDLLYSVACPNVVVKANRKIRGGWQRRLGSLLYNLECRALFDLAYWDINGTPKVFPRTFKRLLGLARQDDLIDLEFSILCRREGYPVIEVPIFSSRRHGGTSTTNYQSAARLYWGAFQMWRAPDELRPGR